MKMKVSAIWRMLSFLVLGMVLGMYLSLKFIAPPSQDIEIGKIKIKGRDISDGVDIEKKDQGEAEQKRKFKIFNR